MRTRKSRSIDTSAAKAMPGVIAVLTGAELGKRQDRQPDLRLDDPFQGRLADEDGAASGAGARQGATMSASRRCRDCRNAGAGARRRGEGQGRLRSAARGDRSCKGARPVAANSRRSRPTTRSTNGISATQGATDAAFAPPSTSPNSTSSITGWCRMRSSRVPRWPSTMPAPMAYAVEHDAEPACGAAGALPLLSAWRRSTNCA